MRTACDTIATTKSLAVQFLGCVGAALIDGIEAVTTDVHLTVKVGCNKDLPHLSTGAKQRSTVKPVLWTTHAVKVI